MLRAIGPVTFTAASFLSLAICLATIALWVRSTQNLDRLRSSSAARRVTLHTKDGEVYVDVSQASAPMWRPGYQHIHALPTQYKPPRYAWEIAGLGVGSEVTTSAEGVVRRRFVEIPLWPVAVLSAILPVMWFDRRSGGAQTTEPAAHPAPQVPPAPGTRPSHAA